MSTSYFAGFDVVTRDANGYTTPAGGETVGAYNVATNTLISNVTSNAEGYVAGATLAVHPLTLVEFRCGTGKLRQYTATPHSQAFSEEVTLIKTDNFTTTTGSDFADLYLFDDDNPDAAPVFLGTQRRGTVVKYPLESSLAKEFTLRAQSKTFDGQIATPIFTAPSASITVPSNRPADQIEIGVTGVLGASGGILYDNAGMLGRVTIGSGLTFSGGTLSAATGITIGSTAITSGTNNRLLYQAGGVVQQSAAMTFDGTNITFAPTNTFVQGTGFYVGTNGVSTGFFFRGGSTGANTYSDFQMVAGGGSREWKMINQLSSRTPLFITGGSDAQNANNSMVGVGSTSPNAQLSVQSLVSGRNIFELFTSGAALVWRTDNNGDTTIGDGCDFAFNATTGSKLGTATSQKLALWNKTPIVQPTTAIAGATRVGGGGTNLTDTDTFGGYTVAQVVQALRDFGVLA